MIKDVHSIKDKYKPIPIEMSTEEILESLRIEKMEDPNYYLYLEDSNKTKDGNVKTKSKENSAASCSDFNKKKCNSNFDCAMDASTTTVYHTCHKRVCEKSLVQIKNSLPRYNKYIRCTSTVNVLYIYIY